VRSASPAHIDEIHWRAGFVLWLHLLITVWFPYRRRFLLVILNLPGAIAVGAVLAVIYPAAAITMWTNLHAAYARVWRSP
jgi:hypothetical protein